MIRLSGKRPSNLGLQHGSLRPCPSSPNCVCSIPEDQGKDAYVAPIAFAGDANQALAHLERVLRGFDGCEIVTRNNNYLHAEFRTKWLGFTDDFEATCEQGNGDTKNDEKVQLHVRSGSRLGRSDLGVNRKRIEQIRAKFTAIV